MSREASCDDVIAIVTSSSGRLMLNVEELHLAEILDPVFQVVESVHLNVAFNTFNTFEDDFCQLFKIICLAFQQISGHKDETFLLKKHTS